MPQIHTKDPNEVADYQINWATKLVTDTINTTTWVIPSGITKDSDSNTTQTTTISVSAGTDGTDYVLLNRIVTVGGKTWEDWILIECRHAGPYTIGGRSIVDSIRWQVDDRDEKAYDYSNRDLNDLIGKAVQLYSQYRPFSRKSTLTTVKDQDLYALPADCTRLQSCEYRTAEANEYDELDSYYPWLFEDWDRASLILIRNMLISAYDEVGMGMWAEINYPSSYMGGRYVLLYPAPDTSGDSIEIWYSTEHPRSGTDYPTVSAEHAAYIEDLVVAFISQREARLMMHGIVDYDAGQTRVRRRPQELLQASRNEINRICRALSTTVATRGKRAEP